MLSDSGLTTQQVLDVFSAEIDAHGGRVTDTFHEAQMLFTRCVLPSTEEVRPKDHVQGGVALKATFNNVVVYPYVFRQICRNGAIMAQALGSHSLGSIQEFEPESVLESIREEIHACCAPEVFQDTVHRMRTACDVQADLALSLLPMLSRFRGFANSALMSRIMRQFFEDGDRSQFGLANAVTAVARDTRDPQQKWDLEEFGGGIAICEVPRTPMDDERAKKANPAWAVASR